MEWQNRIDPGNRRQRHDPAATSFGAIPPIVVVPPPAVATVIPTLTDWGLIVLAMLVGAMALVSLRRRNGTPL